eukprot:4205042-Amphidinium_carterae.2
MSSNASGDGKTLAGSDGIVKIRQRFSDAIKHAVHTRMADAAQHDWPIGSSASQILNNSQIRGALCPTGRQTLEQVEEDQKLSSHWTSGTRRIDDLGEGATGTIENLQEDHAAS